MADPVTWIAVGPAVLGAVGSIKTAQAQSAAADANASVARQNSIIATSQGASASEMLQRDTERRMGATVAGYAASGVDLDTGSPADVLAESARSATLDALTTKYNYKLKAMGYDTQAAFASAESKNATTAGYLSAAGQLANGFASYYRYKRAPT